MTENRLANETSPYLRQHAHNPVDWYPWGEEALRVAAELDRPLFVSIGYSACHWCHVMAHESFEDPATAELLNGAFVAVKVDREERPDIDTIYMEAVQAQSGSGGWPMSVFCAPDGRPFYAGTYFPKRPGPRLPSFTQILEAVITAWAERREELLGQAESLTAAVDERLAPLSGAGEGRPAAELLDAALERFRQLYDPEWGGIGQAPKFPQAPMLELLLRGEHLGRVGSPSPAEMLDHSLAAMAAGGIYDHLGGGFHRYSVDRHWLVPHFEKMLYDQAALARLYLHAYLVRHDEHLATVATETIDYVLRDLTGRDGGLCSSEDADSEGEEGRFYLWSPESLVEVLGAARAEVAAAHFRVRGAPNFEGAFILHRPIGAPAAYDQGAEIADIRAALLAAREHRVRPGRDDKVLLEWNAMMLATLAEAGAALDNGHYLEVAGALGDFLLDRLRGPDGRLLRSYMDGRAANLALAADYAWLVEALTRLAEATGRARWLSEAIAVGDGLIALFGAPDGGFFQTGSDAPALVLRPRDNYDGVTPSATSIATSALLRLGALSGEVRFAERAEEALAASAVALERGPVALSYLLQAKLSAESGITEVVTPGRADLAALVQRRYLPEVVLAWGERGESPLFADRADGVAYLCSGGVCFAPVERAPELVAALGALAGR